MSASLMPHSSPSSRYSARLSPRKSIACATSPCCIAMKPAPPSAAARPGPSSACRKRAALPPQAAHVRRGALQPAPPRPRPPPAPVFRLPKRAGTPLEKPQGPSRSAESVRHGGLDAKRLRPHVRRESVALFERLVGVVVSLPLVRPRRPKVMQRPREPYGGFYLTFLRQPSHGDAQIAVLPLKAVQPDNLVWTHQLGMRLFGHLQKECGVSAPYHFGLCGLLELLQRVLPNRLEHPVAPLVTARYHQRLLH